MPIVYLPVWVRRCNTLKQANPLFKKEEEYLETGGRLLLMRAIKAVTQVPSYKVIKADSLNLMAERRVLGGNDCADGWTGFHATTISPSPMYSKLCTSELPFHRFKIPSAWNRERVDGGFQEILQ